ncbi:Protein of unknown function [Bacillus mycoides]|nr:Protein of unknown function [Bacillus mycoides]
MNERPKVEEVLGDTITSNCIMMEYLERLVW